MICKICGKHFTPWQKPETAKPKNGKLAQINAKLRELKQKLGESDFNSILKTAKVDLKKGVSIKKAEEVISLLEQYVIEPTGEDIGEYINEKEIQE